MRWWAGLALVLMIAGLWGCGGSRTSSTSSSTAGAAPSGVAPVGASASSAASPVPVLTANVQVRAMTLLGDADAQQSIGLRSQLESEGFSLSPDGTLLVWPSAPASAWVVEFGTQRVFTDVDGTFTLQRPTDGTTAGRLHNPADAGIVVPFSLEQMARSGGRLVVPAAFHGSCGMNVDDSACCAQGCAGKTVAPQPRGAASSGDDCEPELHLFNNSRQIIHLTRGAYPDPSIISNPTKLIHCVQADGYLQGVSTTDKLVYLGSTCDTYVRLGACSNENPFSDAEYIAKIADEPTRGYLGFLKSLIGGGEYLSPPVIPSLDNLHCYQLHKGRNCAMLCIGDVSAQFPDDNNLLVRPGASDSVTVSRFRTSVSLIVHNDGAFGITKVIKTRNEIGGLLTGSGFVAIGDTGQFEIRHYLPKDYVPNPHEGASEMPRYVADQNAVYTVPTGTTPSDGAVDSYDIVVDNKKLSFGFLYLCPPPVVNALNPTSGSVGDVVTITGQHLGGNDAHVRFNGVEAAVQSAGENTLTVKVPDAASAAGSPVTVSVDNLCQNVAAGQFTYNSTGCDVVPAGAITGSLWFGHQVTITGSGLGGSKSQVFFTDDDGRVDVSAAVSPASTDTSLTVTVPNGARSGFINITKGSCTFPLSDAGGSAQAQPVSLPLSITVTATNNPQCLTGAKSGKAALLYNTKVPFAFVRIGGFSITVPDGAASGGEINCGGTYDIGTGNFSASGGANTNTSGSVTISLQGRIGADGTGAGTINRIDPFGCVSQYTFSTVPR